MDTSGLYPSAKTSRLGSQAWMRGSRGHGERGRAGGRAAREEWRPGPSAPLATLQACRKLLTFGVSPLQPCSIAQKYENPARVDGLTSSFHSGNSELYSQWTQLTPSVVLCNFP